ncbi:MAG TPA: hypothetical protein VIZ69_04450 [Thermoanaerobaculia bacterium]
MSEAVAGSHAPEIEPEWIWTLLGASRLLAIGSALLLAASLVIAGADAIIAAAGPWVFLAYLSVVPAFILLNVLGVLFHLLGWYSLSEGSSWWTPMRAAFLVSVVGFVIGVVVYVLVEVPAPGYFILFGGWLLIPFAAFAYGPVIIGHGTIFLLASLRLRAAPRLSLLVVGAAVLLALGSVGLSVHLWSLAGSSFPLWTFLLPGLTCIGYGLTAWALQQEYEQHRVRLGPQTNWPFRS